MNLRCPMYLLVWMIAPVLLFGQQSALKVSNPNPQPGEPIVIEVNVNPDQTTRILWSKKGDGEFMTKTEGQKSVKFVPSTPGSTVIISCDVSVSGRRDRSSTEIRVAVAQSPQSAQPVQGNPQVHHPGEMLLASMADMVASGYMGDAIDGAAVLDTGFNKGCQTGSVSCIEIEYKPEDGKAGWAAFAWQHVIDGSDNWGQSPGTDFSAGGYRSLRLFARGIPDAAGMNPKVQFKSGGNVAPKYVSNRASYSVAGPTVQLTGLFQEYCLSLEGRDLSNTVSPFTVVMAKSSNARTIVFVMDDIRFSTQPCN